MKNIQYQQKAVSELVERPSGYFLLAEIAIRSCSKHQLAAERQLWLLICLCD